MGFSGKLTDKVKIKRGGLSRITTIHNYSMCPNKRDRGKAVSIFFKKLILCALDMNFLLLFSPMVEINLLCPVHRVYPGNFVTTAEKRPLWGLSRPYYVCLVY